ncbi:MAG: hypothetical protein GTO53_13875 [Planctomycetales bacterium]|nr:hypothetical protein [Planctomycetales bacterium]NIM10176.1 hypothetical protein [Planctomycetales bacterium]NIN09602.1 hypothetical protein [Planctomycetales bacterium]NIN78725.1 hypothetical protein [Planctomycetales bacterium]NIO35902.1 hypothetical protein [Planctomycetales bacterium]
MSFQEMHQQQGRFLQDYVDFLLHNHKWWLAPVGLVLLVVDAIERLIVRGTPSLGA